MALDEYTILDIETTGLSRHSDRITEIAAIKFRDSALVSEFHTLVNPQRPIPRFVTNLTGITNKMVKDAEPVELILPRFLDFLGDSVIIAHNATFDYGFIDHNTQKHLGLFLSNPRICTRKLASRILPELPSKRLSAVCEHFSITNFQEHRAMGDAKATAEVFWNFVSLLEDAGMNTQNQIFQFERSPIKRCRRMLENGSACRKKEIVEIEGMQ